MEYNFITDYMTLYKYINGKLNDKKKIQDETMLRNVANFAMDNIGSLVSSNNIANTMISDGKDINVRTVERYLEGFMESFFLYKASRYDINSDKIPLANEDGIKIRNVLEWLLDK